MIHLDCITFMIVVTDSIKCFCGCLDSNLSVNDKYKGSFELIGYDIWNIWPWQGQCQGSPVWYNDKLLGCQVRYDSEKWLLQVNLVKV